MRCGLALLAFLGSAALAPGAAGAAALAIIHAKAWTGDVPAPVDDATLVIRDGRVVTVTPHGPAPAGAQVIDAAGRTVTPGLFNASTQLGLVEVSDVDETSDAAVKASPLGAAFDIAPALNANSELIAVARADGLTRAMSAPTGSGSAPFAGQGALIRLKPGPDVLERSRAALYATIGGGSAAAVGGSRAAAWALLHNALDEARRARLRPSSALSPRDQLINHLDAEALRPVLDGREPLVLAVDREADIRQAVRLADEEHLRLVIQGGTEAWRAAPLLAAHNVPVVLDPFANLPTSFDEIGARLDNAARLQRAGVLIAFAQVSTFAVEYRSLNAGLDLRESAGLAVANGLPWPAALAAITTNPARIFGLPGAEGLAPGADADLVIWHGDPLDVSGWPDLVLVDGAPVSLQTRQTLLRDRYAPAHRTRPLGPAYP